MQAVQSVLDPAGPQAGRIASLLWFFLILLGVVFLTVMGVLLRTLTRRHRGFEQEPLESSHVPSDETEARLTRTVGGAVVTTVVILFVLLISSVSTGKAISRLAGKEHGLTIEVTGNQWWWYLRYMDDDPSRIVVTANELHIPVGRPVQIRGSSNDVIHSFWAPNLHGKRDLIPSRITAEWIEADRPGRFRGQCAEFCGLQHAHMAMWVIAEPEEQFEKWMRGQRQPAAVPDNAVTERGQQVFMSNACVYCHTIDGTTAMGQAGPNLTHVASRSTLAAGTLPNNRGNLGGWIVDPQTIKPGTHMATINIRPEDMQPLIEYLESLK